MYVSHYDKQLVHRKHTNTPKTLNRLVFNVLLNVLNMFNFFQFLFFQHYYFNKNVFTPVVRR